MSTQIEPDKEILAITTVNAALKELDAQAQSRVIEYVLKKLNLTLQASTRERVEESRSDDAPSDSHADNSKGQNETNLDSSADQFTGISPVAQRWIQRNGLRAEQLSSIFSLGGDEID